MRNASAALTSWVVVEAIIAIGAYADYSLTAETTV
jgi:hypothetical protein